ncbi:MAG: SdpI family protein [Candidatus Buchananbacteria bacterium]|nr:SdpI family protein [Candidatus Buchananbacteria bacterium]
MKHPLTPNIKTEIMPVITLILLAVISVYFYNNFPNQVPTHWNYRGEVDGYSGKAFGAFGIPVIIVVMYVMFLLFPLLDPKKDRYQQFKKTYHVFKTMIIVVMGLIYFYSGLAALGYPVSINIAVPATIGLLFIVMGNYMSKIKSNWFIGIRTPWTLSNEEVWNKTHRVGGKIFIALGAFMIIGIFLPDKIYWQGFIVSLLASVVGMMGYSYWIFKKINKN